MKPYVIRGSTLILLTLISLLSLILISFSVVGLYVLADESTPAGVFIFCSVLLILIFVSGIAMFCKELFAYFSKVIIDEKTITWIRPFRKKCSFALTQLSFWGCVAYAPRSAMIYFCAEEAENLMTHLETHQKECYRIFGVDRCEQMKKCSIGRLQLAAGTYIRKHLSGTENLFVLRYGSVRRTKSIVHVLKRDAMITGPWLIDTASDWEQVIRYHPE